MYDVIFNVALHSFYNGIAKESYNEFREVSKTYDEITNGGKSWDFGSHTKEENQVYQRTNHGMQKHCIISTVFFVMAIESLINEYGSVYLGEDQFKDKEKLGIMDKITEFYFEVKGSKFPRDKQLYQKINDLVSVRNNLVHSKPITIDSRMMMKNTKEADEQFWGYINSMFGNNKSKLSKQKHMYEVLKQSYSTYEDLRDFLKGVDTRIKS
ncbi:hypothetical protein [Alkalihalobacillus sp. AL-G]|uniref:hypothetical protein n=1 Tax=Alkalihalobacillus sp. AL-G TaxID=2926399 RepID=UPI00272C2EF1|nr:hypothetical protein [Alkalihalobacillus sp. AL-G]WLD91767.1 hypothetical protein MOJ78_12035 [Alkalihalobacillus sp. AL-G]